MEETTCVACAGTLYVAHVNPDGDLCWSCQGVFNLRNQPVKVCECGSVKAGDKYHARWCPIYVDPMNSKKSTSDSDDTEIVYF